MEQLSGLDTAFIHQDTTRTPMHVCAVLLYDAGEHGEFRLDRDQLLELAASRLQSFPLFNRKLHRVTLDMDTPYWVDAGVPKWQQHISERELPEPGGWAVLQDFLARLHGQRMDLKRPLWEMHLLHGLHDLPTLPVRCQALVLKVHHAAIDGISLAAIIHDLHREITGKASDAASPRGDGPAPSRWDVWARANLNSFSRQLKLVETVRNLMPGVLRARETRQQFTDLPPVHRGRAHFNNRVSNERCTGALLLPRADVLAVKRAARRVTFNDIAMACVAGALRRYLGEHAKLPQNSLASGIPINLRGSGDQSASGNKIGTMVVGLATEVEDPLERLRAIHRYAVAGKKQISALGTGTVMDLSDSVAPGILAEGIRTIAWATTVADMPVPFHTMISNVPGPGNRVALGDARLVASIGLGPIRDNSGLFHIVSSTEDNFSVSFTACRKLLPDPAHYQDCLEAAFDDLYQSALAEQE